MLSLYERMPIYVTGPGTRYFDLLQGGLQEGVSQSLQLRLQGAPDISVVLDEQRLVFDGHLERALGVIDGEIASVGQS
ncbi:hypothetical protein D3C72_1858610 [compost metagenome]